MSDFFKKFLLEDARRLSPSGRYAGLAAFGKHPGWDDHVEDLGLETESLNLAKIVFYVNGIGGQIDAGAWEKLEAAQQLPGFKHLFVWQRSGQLLIGRLWSSSDGKGRKRYPMVVCAHLTGVTLGWALKQVLPVLADLEAGCLKATTAEEVRSLLAGKRAALREAIAATDGAGEYAPVSPEALSRILKGGGEAGGEGFLRVLYQIENQATAFAGSRAGANSPAEIRVPLAAENPEQALLFWTRFFQSQMDPSVPLLLALPLDAGWVDMTAGEPESHQFFCLRATPKAVPLASEVPYNLDEAFRARGRAFLDGFGRGETTFITKPAAETPKAVSPVPGGGGMLKWIALGVLAVVIVVVAIVMSSRKDQPPAPGPLNPAPPATNAALPTIAPVAPATAQPPPKSPEELAAEKAREEEARKSAADVAAAGRAVEAAKAEAQERERLAELARQKELEEQRKREAAEAARKKLEEEEAARKKQPATVAAAPAPTSAPGPGGSTIAPAGTPLIAPKPGQKEFTNSIGMVLVQLPSGLIVGKFEVTQAEYYAVMSARPSALLNDSHPVERVTLEDAQEFCRKLTEKEPGFLGAAKYSLPTETQWQEIRAGQKFEDVAEGMTNATTTPAGSFKPNPLGLYDVLGNVWEWTLDPDPKKVLKGGAFDNKDRAYEKAAPIGGKGKNSGFRCVVAPR